jgi:predicted oxidoreductase
MPARCPAGCSRASRTTWTARGSTSRASRAAPSCTRTECGTNPEGITNHSPVWNRHGIRILGAELALSGSEQNPDLTGRDVRLLLERALPGAVGPVETFAAESPEFLWADTPGELATGLGKDLQVGATAMARRYVVDRLIRVAPPHELLDPHHGPLLAIRLSVLTRKTLGGLLTDTQARVLRPDGSVLTGLYAVGEAAGFGGGGVHGHRPSASANRTNWPFRVDTAHRSGPSRCPGARRVDRFGP